MSRFADRTVEKRHGLANYPVSDFILQRSSPRAMSGEGIPHEELMKLFDAARWAPSSYNRQPWTFVYSTRGSSSWGAFLEALLPTNREWCENAAVLAVMLSTQWEPGHPSKLFKTASFDCGAAWENLCLQGVEDGLVVHGMEGFHEEKIKDTISPAPYQKIEMMLAIGLPADKSVLPSKLRERETVSDRKDLECFVFQHHFRGDPQ